MFVTIRTKNGQKHPKTKKTIKIIKNQTNNNQKIKTIKKENKPIEQKSSTYKLLNKQNTNF